MSKQFVLQSIDDVNSQLAAKASQEEVSNINTAVGLKAEKTYVDTLAASLASGSPKGIYATVSALNTSIPSGNNNIYIVQNPIGDGNDYWYYWDGSAWTRGKVYQSTGIGEDTITEKMVVFMEQSQNIFKGWYLGKGINNTTGAETTNANSANSDFISVVPSTNYTLSYNKDETYVSITAYYYDSSKVFISKEILSVSSITKTGTFVAVVGTAFVRLCSYNATNTSILMPKETQLELGTSKTEYILNKTIGKKAIHNKSITKEKIDDYAVGTEHLDDKSITNAKLAEKSVDIKNLVYDISKYFYIAWTFELGSLSNFLDADGFGKRMRTSGFTITEPIEITSSDTNLNIIAQMKDSVGTITSIGNYSNTITLTNTSTSYRLLVRYGDGATTFDSHGYTNITVSNAIKGISQSNIDNRFKNNQVVVAPYFETEINTTLNSVLSITDEPCLVMINVTDTHYTPNTDGKKWNETILNIKSLCNKLDIDCINHLGDLVYGDVAKDVTKGYLQTMTNDMQNIAEAYIVMGNHDDNHFLSGYTANDLIRENEWYSITQRKNWKKTVRNSNKSFYYVDYPEIKIRCIYLNSWFNVDGTTTKNWSWQPCMDWLTNTALITGDGWSIALFAHSVCVPQINFDAMAFEYNSNLINALLSYIDEGKGKRIIGWFYGHLHTDAVFNIDNIPFPFIATTCSLPQKSSTEISYTNSSNVTTTSISPNRVLNTVTQDAWDVMIIRPSKRKVNLVRFGAGNDREISY